MGPKFPVIDFHTRLGEMQDGSLAMDYDTGELVARLRSKGISRAVNLDMMYDDIQFTLRMHSCEQSLRLLPDDYIPCAFVDVGCVGISQAFGAKVYYGDNPQQTPGVRGHVLDSIEDTYDLKAPDVIAIPLIRITDESIDPRAYYGRLRKISDEYAHRVFG